MNLPPTFHFLRPGWWALHIVAIAAIGGGAFALGTHLAASHAHGAPPASPGSNPVQVEMRLLEGALATAPSLFASGDLRPLEHALHGVHGARENTDDALESGSYRLPRNADQVARFRQLDAAFHADLERLAEHAAKSELEPAASAYGRVLSACNGCHAEFRAAPR
jgi:hypothetical protein